jgi:hypothetical protein
MTDIAKVLDVVSKDHMTDIAKVLDVSKIHTLYMSKKMHCLASLIQFCHFPAINTITEPIQEKLVSDLIIKSVFVCNDVKCSNSHTASFHLLSSIAKTHPNIIKKKWDVDIKSLFNDSKQFNGVGSKRRIEAFKFFQVFVESISIIQKQIEIEPTDNIVANNVTLLLW